MVINEYAFGCIVIDGKAYSNDLVLLPGEVRPGWWREHGRSLVAEDLSEVFEAEPEIVVIGTGAKGGLAVPPETRSAIEAAGITPVIEATEEAVRRFNALVEAGRDVAGVFHLR